MAQKWPARAASLDSLFGALHPHGGAQGTLQGLDPRGEFCLGEAPGCETDALGGSARQNRCFGGLRPAKPMLWGASPGEMGEASVLLGIWPLVTLDDAARMGTLPACTLQRVLGFWGGPVARACRGFSSMDRGDGIVAMGSWRWYRGDMTGRHRGDGIVAI